MDYKKIFLVLMFLLNISFISADSDGVWHEAEDVVGGIFANDQDVKDFTFPGLVTFQSNTFFDGNVGVGTYTPSSKLDIVGNINVSTIYDRENNAFYINPGSISNMNEIRADIFKDRNDVNYYLDPASSSRLNSLVLGSGSDASLDILGGGWYNGCNGDECKNILDIDLRNGFESELRVRNSCNDGNCDGNFGDNLAKLMVKGALYVDSVPGITGSGYLRTNGELRSETVVRAPYFLDINNANYYVDPASTSYLNDVRANIFRDRNDASFYVNPASTSILNRIDASIMYDRDNTGYYSDPASTNRLNAIDSNSIYVRGAITSPEGTLRDDNGGWIRTYGNTGWYSQTYGGGFYMQDSNWIRAYNNKNILSGGEIRAGSTMRAPSFIDLNDGNYYVDPNSVSYFNDIRPNIIYDRQNTGFYVDPNSVSILNDVRASIIYDRDNTGYYLNPNGVSYTSRIRSAGGSSPAYGDELVTKSYVDSRPGGATAVASGTIGWSCGTQWVYPGVGIRDTNSYTVGLRITGGWRVWIPSGSITVQSGPIQKQWGYNQPNWYERVAFPVTMGCSNVAAYPSGVQWVLYRVNN